MIAPLQSLVQLKISEAVGKSSLLEKAMSDVAVLKRLEFSYFHSCLSLSDCHSFLSLLSLLFRLTSELKN